MIAGYLEHLKESGYSGATVAATKAWLRHLEEHCGGRLAELKAAELTAYQQSLRWQPGPSGKMYAENTVNQATDVVRRFFRWAALAGLIDRDPAAHLTTRRVLAKPRRELSVCEIRKLLAQPDLGTFSGCRDRAILGLIIETRVSAPALSRLEIDHFEPDMAALLVSGRRREILGLSDGLLSDLVRYLGEARPGVAASGETALFIGRAGRRLSPAAFRQVVATHARRAGVPKPSFFS